eukprot:SAG31_NODE_16207_length_718_cov_1.974152_2_plen_44_part_01
MRDAHMSLRPQTLLQCGTFTPDRIMVSTRRPEELLTFQARGVVR